MRTNVTNLHEPLVRSRQQEEPCCQILLCWNGHTARGTLRKTSARHHVVRTWSLARSTMPAADRRRHPCVDDEKDYTELWAERERLGECNNHVTFASDGVPAVGQMQRCIVYLRLIPPIDTATIVN